MSDFRRLEKELFIGRGATIGTKGRYGELEPDDIRLDFQRDVHRIIYSQAFRRLRHKAQVFHFPRNDHVTTRMGHVLFVAFAARTIARSLRLNEDLAEAVGLAHDIGHAPFGHQGEIFLTGIVEEIIKDNSNFKKNMPVFHHEVHGLRVVDKLAKLDREIPGLNLTWEVRDGIISHCGEDFGTCKIEPGDKNKNLEAIRRREEAGNPATLEGCIVRLIDKVAYCGKDIEDAIEVNIIKKSEIPPGIDKELGSNNGQIIGTFVKDMIKNSYKRDYISISQERCDLLHNMIKFNNKHIYHSEKAEKYAQQAEQDIKLLFDKLLEKLQTTRRFESCDEDEQDEYNVYKVFHRFVYEDMKSIYDDSVPDELIVLDFIAGMTDGFVLRSFKELFIPQATV